jgi:hypothetical protein
MEMLKRLSEVIMALLQFPKISHPVADRRANDMKAIDTVLVMNIGAFLNDLHQHKNALDVAISALEGISTKHSIRIGRPPGSDKRRRVMSPDARAKIRAAARRRWAAKKAGKSRLG